VRLLSVSQYLHDADVIACETQASSGRLERVSHRPEPSHPVRVAEDFEDAADGAGPALFRLVRLGSRRWINRASQELTGEMRHVQHILAIEAVDTAQSRGQDPTVAAVAHQLGLDDSGASRIVRGATDAGYLLRGASRSDRRRASLTLTDRGRELLASSHRWQQRTFEQLTAHWDPQDRTQLAGYLQRLARELDLDVGP